MGKQSLTSHPPVENKWKKSPSEMNESYSENIGKRMKSEIWQMWESKTYIWCSPEIFAEKQKRREKKVLVLTSAYKLIGFNFVFIESTLKMNTN